MKQTQQAERWEFSDWISPFKFALIHNNLLQHKQPETGIWLLEHQQFQEWKELPNQTLCCQGMPGAGKSTLVATIVEHLKHTYQDATIAYAYFKYDTPNQTPANMLGSLLQTAFSQKSILPQEAIDLHTLCRQDLRRPTSDELCHLFKEPFPKKNRFFMIVDALDEAPVEDGYRSAFLQAIFKIQAECQVNLLVTFRFDDILAHEMSTNTTCLHLEIRASVHDVERFVKASVRDFPASIQRKPELQELITERISRASDGMFLLAKLHVDAIKKTKDPRKVKSIIDNFKNDPLSAEAKLDKVYNQALERMEDFGREVIGWILFYKEPLTIGCLQHILSIQPNSVSIDPDYVCEVEDLLTSCVGLITLDPQSRSLRFVHFTAQGYFWTQRHELFQEASYRMLDCCLTYLSLPSLHVAINQKESWKHTIIPRGFWYERIEPNDLKDQFPFWTYASSVWPSLFNDAYPNSEKSLDRLLDFLDREPRELAASFAVLWLDTKTRRVPALRVSGSKKRYLPIIYPWSSPTEISENDYEYHPFQVKVPKDSPATSGLHVAAALGLDNVLKQLISRGQNVNTSDASGLTPLEVACAYGHYDVVTACLDAGAQVHHTALAACLTYGQSQLLKILLEHVTPDGLNDTDNPWLHALIDEFNGSTDELLLLVVALIEAGADPCLQDCRGLTALHWAVQIQRRSLSLVKKIISSTPAPNVYARDEHYQTALDYAARPRHWNGEDQKLLREVLLQAGADTKSKTKKGDLALLTRTDFDNEANENERSSVSEGSSPCLSPCLSPYLGPELPDNPEDKEMILLLDNPEEREMVLLPVDGPDLKDDASMSTTIKVPEPMS